MGTLVLVEAVRIAVAVGNLGDVVHNLGVLDAVVALHSWFE